MSEDLFVGEMTLETTKAVIVDLDSLSKSTLIFRYRIELLRKDAIYAKVDVFDSTGGVIKGVYKDIAGKQLIELMTQAEKITPAGGTALEYFQRLIGNGIKIYIVSQGLWQGLTMDDFA